VTDVGDTETEGAPFTVATAVLKRAVAFVLSITLTEKP
jgi:hypothetical protein